MSLLKNIGEDLFKTAYMLSEIDIVFRKVMNVQNFRSEISDIFELSLLSMDFNKIKTESAMFDKFEIINFTVEILSDIVNKIVAVNLLKDNISDINSAIEYIQSHGPRSGFNFYWNNNWYMYAFVHKLISQLNNKSTIEVICYKLINGDST